MATSTVTINSSCQPNPSPLGPLVKGNTVNFVNNSSGTCTITFHPPSPFGNPIPPIPPGASSGNQTIIAIVRQRTNFPYTTQCGTGSAAALSPSPLDGSDGIIIVDSGGMGGEKGKKKGQTKSASKKPSSNKAKTKGKAKPKAKAKPKPKAKPKAKAKKTAPKKKAKKPARRRK